MISLADAMRPRVEGRVRKKVRCVGGWESRILEAVVANFM